MLRKILIGIGILFALILLIPFFLADAYQVSESVVIERPDSVVFNYVTDFNNWMAWNPWTEMEPSAVNRITGTPGSVGSAWEWEGEVIGTGRLTIEALQENRVMESHLEFIAPYESEAHDVWIFEPAEGGNTRVTWKNSGELTYFMRYFSSYLESELSSQFNRGLTNLKYVLERDALQEDAAAARSKDIS